MWKTNAQHNRDQAQRMFAAGMTADQIAEEFPLVYKAENHKLGLRYSESATIALHRSDPIAKDCGLLEQDRMVAAYAVDAAIEYADGHVDAEFS